MNKWKNLTCYYGEECIFQDLEFSWADGEQIGFWGYSGCGKTSLLKLIANRLRAEGKKIAYVFQHEVLLDWLTVEQNILLVNVCVEQQKYQKIIELLKLEEHQKKYPRELSGGLRKRVALARAFVCDADYLLLDEAFEFLDGAMQDSILSFLEEEQKQKKKSIFLVTHRLEIIIRLAEKILFFEGEKSKQRLELYIPETEEKTKKRLEEKYATFKSEGIG